MLPTTEGVKGPPNTEYKGQEKDLSVSYHHMEQWSPQTIISFSHGTGSIPDATCHTPTLPGQGAKVLHTGYKDQEKGSVSVFSPQGTGEPINNYIIATYGTGSIPDATCHTPTLQGQGAKVLHTGYKDQEKGSVSVLSPHSTGEPTNNYINF